MKNLNAEQIKKELEGLVNFRTCPEYIKNSLALINSQEQRIGELTEENERLQKANDVLLLMPSLKEIRADTVRKMHSKIKEYFEKDGFYPAKVAVAVDQIAKEMLEGEK